MIGGKVEHQPDARIDVHLSVRHKPGGRRYAFGGHTHVPGMIRLTGKAPFVRFLRIADPDRAIEEAGFEIIETGDYPASPPGHFVVARRL
ncbi:hypothetical protein FIU94_02910 [Sulfitobacter sp. THAF37]|nr:hypothetical protein FIU94_02910 [Sulfitobacter sp. THAF37]